MPIAQVLFVCKSSPDLSPAQSAAAFEILQLDCQAKQIAGFFVATGDGYVGWFEADEALVIGQIEQIVRARKFRHIEVIREHLPKAPSCSDWYVSHGEQVSVAVEALLSPEYLAEFIAIALKPLSKRSQQ